MNSAKKLADAIQKKQLVVILDLPPLSATDIELSKQRLIFDIRKKYSIDDDYSLEELIEYCVRAFDRKTVIPTLTRAIKETDTFPSYYELLEDLGVKYFVEAHYFPLWRNEIEMKLEKQNNYVFYARSEDFLPDDKCVVISLFGDVLYGQEDLIFLQNEFNGFFADANGISASLRSILKGTLLFIDFDPRANRFKGIYDFMCQINNKYPSESFLITSSPSEKLSYGENENLTIINANVSEYLNTIKQFLNRATVHKAGSSNVEKSPLTLPYKYLYSYEQGEQSIFFGREREIHELLQNVQSAKQIAVLTSSSGYGKTSLINAGLIPALEAIDLYEVYYVRADKNPWKSTVEGVFKCDFETFDFEKNDIKLVSNKQYQIIIIDQFEECFVNDDVSVLRQIDDALAKFLNDFPTVTLLISIRQDFFANLTKLSFIKHAQYNATYNLEPMTATNASIAIQKPTELFNFSFESGLIDKIISDLGVEGDINASLVDPSQLQIVCYFLYQVIGSKTDRTISEAIYNELGKASGILENYIEISLKNYTPKDFLLGKEILKCLISPKNTRASKSQTQIIQEIIAIKGYDVQFFDNEIDSMIANLIHARLVRAKAGEIELTHEYIIHKINEWMDVETLEFRKLSELFHNELQKRNQYGSMMTKDLYKDIYRHRSRFSFNNQEKSYLLLCLVYYNCYEADEMKFWIKENIGNPCCKDDLKWAMESFTGKSRIFAGVVLSLICQSDETFDEICELLKDNINPHLSSVEDELAAIGEVINKTFSKKMHTLLEDARTSGMCILKSSNSIRLGLDAKECKNIMKKYDIARQLKPYFPYEERRVSLPTFYIDEITVTNKMYSEYNESHHYTVGHEDYPVVGLTLKQAQEYANWWGKDLPSEDEWEYAARGSDFRQFPWGEDWNYESEKAKPESEKRCNTSLTGTDGARSSKEYVNGRSPCGCLNMSGNVWEWTKTPAPSDEKRVIVKGGSWSMMDIKPWAWYRYTYDKDFGQQNIGFRCVLRRGE